MNEILKRYEEILRLKNLSDTTIDNYIRKIKKFLIGCNATSWRQLKGLTTSDVERYLTEQQLKYKWAAGTFNNYVAYIKAFNNKMIQYKVIKNDFANSISKQKQVVSDPKYLNDEEMLSMIRCNIKERDNLMLKILFKTGVRRSELLRIRMSNINDGMLTTISKGTERVIPIDQQLIDDINTYYNSKKAYMDDYLFNTNQGKPIDPVWVSKQFKGAWMIKAGISESRRNELKLHCSRKTFSTKLVENNTNIFNMKALLGHKDIKTTQRYVIATRKGLKQSMGNIQFGF